MAFGLIREVETKTKTNNLGIKTLYYVFGIQLLEDTIFSLLAKFFYKYNLPTASVHVHCYVTFERL